MEFLVVLYQVSIAGVKQDGQTERFKCVQVVGPVWIVKLKFVTIGIVVREIVRLKMGLLRFFLTANQRWHVGRLRALS